MAHCNSAQRLIMPSFSRAFVLASFLVLLASPVRVSCASSRENPEYVKKMSGLLKRLDVDGDGKVSEEEMVNWNVAVTLASQNKSQWQTFQSLDLDKDGLVSFADAVFDDDVDEPTEEALPTIDANRRRFSALDTDNDGKLNFEEYKMFNDPASIPDPSIRKEQRLEAIREYDKDEDDHLTLEEFGNSFYHSLVHWPKYNPDFQRAVHTSETKGISREEEADRLYKFKLLDKNDDWFLDESELEPVMGLLRPSQLEEWREQALHSFRQMDEDHDGLLTLEEMKARASQFVATAFALLDKRELEQLESEDSAEDHEEL